MIDAMPRYCLTLDLDDVEGWITLLTPEATYREVCGRIFAAARVGGRSWGLPDLGPASGLLARRFSLPSDVAGLTCSRTAQVILRRALTPRGRHWCTAAEE